MRCNEASQRKLRTSPEMSLIGRAVKFKKKLEALWRHLQWKHFKHGVCSGAAPIFNRNFQASARAAHGFSSVSEFGGPLAVFFFYKAK
jgi:hypothetical protein